ncbi:MAG: CapA family protein [Clostridiales bacterium]|jgi:poly-gamma-glutamate synthesis protein (capsule biosynthesis protein)|nr:CapA family protein [Clostridiales bacterium]
MNIRAIMAAAIFTMAAIRSNAFLQEETTITISAAGDCTLGSDYRAGYHNSLLHEYERQGTEEYFLRNVRHIFEADDLTLANLEGPLTDAEAHEDKEFVFKGPPSLALALSAGGVDAVTIANNHTYDYLAKGYADTMESLDDAGVDYFGNGLTLMKEVKGVKIGLFGYRVWDASRYNKDRIAEAITALREDGARIIVAFYHWGEEKQYYPNAVQKEMGRFTIDCGANLVLGSHPHVLQGVEVYKGRNIIYSLGNFCYGGSRHPADPDTFIFQQVFTVRGQRLLNDNACTIIPASVSSVQDRNNFQPTPMDGGDADRILEKISNLRVSEGA